MFLFCHPVCQYWNKGVVYGKQLVTLTQCQGTKWVVVPIFQLKIGEYKTTQSQHWVSFLTMYIPLVPVTFSFQRLKILPSLVILSHMSLIFVNEVNKYNSMPISFCKKLVYTCQNIYFHDRSYLIVREYTLGEFLLTNTRLLPTKT